MNLRRFTAGIFVCFLLLTSRAFAANVTATFNSAADIPVSATSYSAAGNTITFALNFAPATGTELTVVKNTGLDFIQGSFNSLPHGKEVSLLFNGTNYHFVANYYGGSGNDLVLAWKGTLPYAWGLNSNGQLGDSSKVSRRSPIPVNANTALAGKTVLSLASGSAHSLALCSDGTVFAWGDNAKFQLGDGTKTDRTTPIKVNGLLTDKIVVAIAAGQFHSLALCSDGTIYSWGLNNFGQLGIGSLKSSPLPVQVSTADTALVGRTAVAIAAGQNHSMAMCSDGRISTWGANSHGQLGDGTTQRQTLPVFISHSDATLGKTPATIAAGGNHSLLLFSDGSLAGWGRNYRGSLLNYFSPNHRVTIPTSIRTFFDDYGHPSIAIVAGQDHSIIIANSVPVMVTAWGTNNNGQLGIGRQRLVNVPIQLWGALGQNPAACIGAGRLSSQALRTDGTLTAWGYNKHGQLGLGTTAPSLEPTALQPLTDGKQFTKLSVGPTALHSLALVASTLPNAPRLLVSSSSDFNNPLQSNVGEVTFPSTVTATTSTLTFSLKNNGNSVLTISGLNLTGDNAAEFSTSVLSASTLAPAASASFTVTFAPTALGNRNAVLQIASNDTIQNPFLINLSGTGVSTPVPEIALYDGSDTLGTERVSNAGTATFNSTILGSSSNSLTFTIENRGQANLTGLTLTTSGAHSADFTATNLGATTLAPNTTTTFTVTFRPTAVGNRNAVIQVASNDSDENPFLINVFGTGTISIREIAVFNVSDGAERQSNQGSFNFPPSLVASSSGDYSFTIKNTGRETLSGLMLSKAGDNPNDYSLGSLAVTTLTANGTAHFTISFTPTATGNRTATIQIASNDADENPFIINVSGSGTSPEPEVAVFNGIGTGGLERQNNVDSVVLTTTEVGYNSDALTITIKNTGSATLSNLALTMSGINSGDFTLGTLGVNSLAIGETTSFTATFSPTASGTRTGTLQIVSNDADEDPFLINLTAFAEPLQPITLDAVYNSEGDIPVSAGSYTAAGKTVNFTLNYAPGTGTALMIVKHTGLKFIQGTFNNLAQGQPVTLYFEGTDYNFVANYYGGSGNDLVLVWAGTQIYAWGGNDYGQLGTGSGTHFSPYPVSTSNILLGKTVVAVSSSTYHSIALCSDGTLATWGSNSWYQFGNNSTISSSVPVAVDQTGVLAGRRVIAVSARPYQSIVLCSDGTIVAWGINIYGQAGFNHPIPTPLPQVLHSGDADFGNPLPGKTVVAISSGADHTLALCSDGSVAVWGTKYTNSWTFREIPTAINTGALAGKTVVAIAAGSNHNTALCSDGTLAVWGENGSGQLGNNSTVKNYTPVAVNESGVLLGKTVTAIAAGGSHTLALCSDGTLAAWGYNYSGALGDGTQTNRLVPVEVNRAGVLSGKTVASISGNANGSLALCTDGTLAAWGYFAGDGTSASRYSPIQVNPLSDRRFIRAQTCPTAASNFVFVADPQAPEIAVVEPTNSGDFEHQSNIGSVSFQFTEVGSSSSQKVFKIINTGDAHLTGLMLTKIGSHAEDFALGSLGTNDLAPNASTTFSVTFSPTATGSRNAILQIASNDSDENPFLISLNGIAEPMQPLTVDALYTTGMEVPVTAENYSAAGKTVNLTLDHAPLVGTALMVVNNTGLNFIQGNFASLPQGQNVALEFDGVTYNFVANYYGGSGNDLVLVWAGTYPFAWGNNSNGQLGDGSLLPHHLPAAVNTSGILSGKTVLMVAGGYYGFSVALCSEGTIATWGNDTSGAKNSFGNSPNPEPIITNGVLSGKTVVAIAAGDAHCLALCSDGTIVAWGSNNSGQLGNGTTNVGYSPSAVSTAGVLFGKTVMAIAAGSEHSLARCSDGTVVAWGNNAFGQLGTNTTNTTSLPVAVNTTSALSSKTVVAIAAGATHSLAQCSDGTLISWGNNSLGQLGDNTTTQRNVPVAVDTSSGLGSQTVVSISAGANHNLALCSDGTVAAWGYNAFGQLGDNSTTSRLAPQVVPDAGVFTTAVKIAAAHSHSFALSTDGTLAAWGNNSNGQLGDSTTTNRLQPVAVSSAALPPGAQWSGPLSSSSSSAHSLGLVAPP